MKKFIAILIAAAFAASAGSAFAQAKDAAPAKKEAAPAPAKKEAAPAPAKKEAAPAADAKKEAPKK